MGKSTSVVLDGQNYEVPHLNIGQLERVTEALIDGKPATKAYAILRVALQRATPTVASVDELEAGADEVGTAVKAILAANGIAGDKDPNAVAPAGATGAQ